MASEERLPSLLDTDLYKLTMQSAVLKYFPDIEVAYEFTNRTPDLRLSRAGFNWLQGRITGFSKVSVTSAELAYLKNTCSYLSQPYLDFLYDFRLDPSRQLKLEWSPINEGVLPSEDQLGDLKVHIHGLWLDTILWEIPILSLASEAYFKFSDKDWSHDGQKGRARDKGISLLSQGASFSEFGTRRRRDYVTQDLVLQGLCEAKDEAVKKGWEGKLTGTSNVHFAMKYGITPVGTVAHEWFMAVAAITGNYKNANEMALRYWIGTFGEGVLDIALTDTFGTDVFLRDFKKAIPASTSAVPGRAAALPSTGSSLISNANASLAPTELPIDASEQNGSGIKETEQSKTYAQVFGGLRQDSGDPSAFIMEVRKFYDSQGIQDRKAIVFSDSLNVERCLKYKREAEEAGFQPSFGVGTFLTNDFTRKSDGKKSVPMNIVIKLSMANGHNAIKISDNVGKNTGDHDTVEAVKRTLGYEEKSWAEGDEETRWGVRDDNPPAKAGATT